MIVLSCLYEKLIALKYRDAIAFNEFDRNRGSVLNVYRLIIITKIKYNKYGLYEGNTC